MIFEWTLSSADVTFSVPTTDNHEDLIEDICLFQWDINFISRVDTKIWYFHEWCSHEWKCLFFGVHEWNEIDISLKQTNFLFILWLNAFFFSVFCIYIGNRGKRHKKTRQKWRHYNDVIIVWFPMFMTLGGRTDIFLGVEREKVWEKCER